MLEAYKISWLRTFEVKGRMNKNIYKRAMIIHFLLVILPCMVMVYLEIEHLLVYAWLVFFMFSVFPIVSNTIQRLHDVGKSGWNLLIYILLGQILVGWIMLGLTLRKDSDAQDNKWGKYLEPEADVNEKSFVDERLTEQDVKNDRKKLIMVFLKIVGVIMVLNVVGYLIRHVEMLLAPLF